MDTDQRTEPPTETAAAAAPVCRTTSPHAVFSECPHCAGPMRPEHAHFRCGQCGWRDSCCD